MLKQAHTHRQKTPCHTRNQCVFHKMPAEIIGRQRGWTFASTFYSLMYDWMDFVWSYIDTFEKKRLHMADMNVNPNTGNLPGILSVYRWWLPEAGQ